MTLRALALGLALFGLATGGNMVPAPSLAQETRTMGTVIQYKGARLRTFTAEGRPTGDPVLVSTLPRLPARIVARSSGLIGIQNPNGPPVYLRGIDLEFRLDEAASDEICTEIPPSARPNGAVVPGSSAGAGSGRDCRPRPPRPAGQR